MATTADLRTLILYATPTGPLAAACHRFFDILSHDGPDPDPGPGPTTAQTYPPHCTLTGFFRRAGDRARDTITSMGRMVSEAGPVPRDAVEVAALSHHGDWVGLELRSPWLIELTAAIVAAHPPRGDEDALRPKDWLHLSLAYGVPDVGPYLPLADALVDPALPAGWDVRVWERRDDGTWYRHRPPPG